MDAAKISLILIESTMERKIHVQFMAQARQNFFVE